MRNELQQARAGGVHALNSVVFAWLAARPDLAEGILETAFATAPEHRQQIARAVASSFPAYRGLVGEAAGAPATAPAPSAVRPAPATPLAERPAPAAPAPAVPVPPRESPWSGELALGGSRLSGNTESTAVAVAGELIYERRPWELDALVSYDYASEDASTTAQRLAAQLTGRRDIGGRWYAFGDFGYIDDRFSGFAWEASEALGVGYRLVDREDLEVRVEAGPGLRHSKREDTEDVETNAIAQAANFISWQMSENAELSNRLEVEFGEDRTRTVNRTALTTEMLRNISTRLSFEVRNDSNPTPDTKATDTITKVNLVYDF